MPLSLRHISISDKSAEKLSTIQMRRGCNMNKAIEICINIAFEQIFYSNHSSTTNELRAMLHDYGIKQKEVAERIGISSGAVSQALSGRCRSEHVAATIRKMVAEKEKASNSGQATHSS
jgi:predicted transcriptional regulator